MQYSSETITILYRSITNGISCNFIPFRNVNITNNNNIAIVALMYLETLLYFVRAKMTLIKHQREQAKACPILRLELQEFIGYPMYRSICRSPMLNFLLIMVSIFSPSEDKGKVRRRILVIFPMLALYRKVYRKLAPFLNPH